MNSYQDSPDKCSDLEIVEISLKANHKELSTRLIASERSVAIQQKTTEITGVKQINVS